MSGIISKYILSIMYLGKIIQMWIHERTINNPQVWRSMKWEKNQPTCEKSLDTPLEEEKQSCEVDHKLPQGDCREEHKD